MPVSFGNINDVMAFDEGIIESNAYSNVVLIFHFISAANPVMIGAEVPRGQFTF